jgi:phosphoadenosine phosphosulfate reductase
MTDTITEPQNQSDRDDILSKPLDEKIELAEDVVRHALEQYDAEKTVIGFTGGKDSTLVAYIVKKVCEEHGFAKPTFMFVDHGQHFDEIEQFVERIADDWGFDVVVARNDDLIEQADEPGEEVPVEELNDRNQREVERLESDYTEVPWLMNTEAGNHLLKTVPMNELLEEHEFDAVINGVRWDEQEARSDENFFSPRDDPEHMRVHPILPFTEPDVWDFTWNVMIPNTVDGWKTSYDLPHAEADLPEGVELSDLPISPKYWEGFRSLGSEVSTDKTSSDPAWHQDLEGTTERAGRAQDKEGIMNKLRDLGYM